MVVITAIAASHFVTGEQCRLGIVDSETISSGWGMMLSELLWVVFILVLFWSDTIADSQIEIDVDLEAGRVCQKGKGICTPSCRRRRYSFSVAEREHRATKEWNESTPLGKLHEEGVQCSDVQPREEWEKDCGGSNGITPLTSTQ